ncbi:hypothetical protein HHL25_05790 [Rhizobium sp. S-51]|uniref:Uncharacterized protein n=1 Tax=Rhizobium terricola TaxID=2728849 RepID=A0A7Y0FVB9_9HYPH|nr:hypothetical protein [Rhizobium terricola]NML73636.1 hypothetical protein [Rhizobium terricola]
MSDIGSLFTAADIAVMVLVASLPGLVLGAFGGALLHRSRRVPGALYGGLAGLSLTLLAWSLFLTAT